MDTIVLVTNCLISIIHLMPKVRNVHLSKLPLFHSFLERGIWIKHARLDKGRLKIYDDI